MRFKTLVKHPADWMTGKNTDNAVVLTSRIRLARNIQGAVFPGWAKKAQRCEALEAIRPAVDALGVMSKGFSRELNDLTSLQKQVLVERHLISREQAARGEGCAMVVDRKQGLSLMINEEDHLRMQSIRAGLDLSGAYEPLQQVDSELEKQLDFAFDAQLGYLTACPTNLGTGMRASAMLHLPALALSGEHLTQTLQAVSKIGLAVRGLFGEGTESLGHLFQISNQSTLGQSEQAIMRHLEKVLQQVVNHEKNARLKLLEDKPGMVADKIGRAYGLLSYAQMIDSKEAFDLISLLRLGADVGYFEKPMISACDALLMNIQPGHLQLRAGEELEPEKRDEIRAEIIREKLQSFPAPAKGITYKTLSDEDGQQTFMDS